MIICFFYFRGQVGVGYSVSPPGLRGLPSRLHPRLISEEDEPRCFCRLSFVLCCVVASVCLRVCYQVTRQESGCNISCMTRSVRLRVHGRKLREGRRRLVARLEAAAPRLAPSFLWLTGSPRSIGWSNNHFANLHFRSSLERNHTTTSCS